MPTHTLHLKAPSYTVQPGIADYKCFGPWPLPIASGALTHFLPVVDMSAVHHMIVYGGTSNRSACHGIHIIYAWARTGQTEPIGLDLAEHRLGFRIDRQQFSHVSMQIHYQREKGLPLLHNDQSGVRLTMSESPPATPLRVQLNQLIPHVPARSVVDQCVRCQVIRGGTVFGYRNHAHQLGRDIWSDHFKKGRTTQPEDPLGLMDSQKPQIVRMLETPRPLEAGDLIQLHCVYDGSGRPTPTGFGTDAATGEMCNQYLFASASLYIGCAGRACVPSSHKVNISSGGPVIRTQGEL